MVKSSRDIQKAPWRHEIWHNSLEYCKDDNQSTYQTQILNKLDELVLKYHFQNETFFYLIL